MQTCSLKVFLDTAIYTVIIFSLYEFGELIEKFNNNLTIFILKIFPINFLKFFFQNILPRHLILQFLRLTDIHAGPVKGSR